MTDRARPAAALEGAEFRGIALATHDMAKALCFYDAMGAVVPNGLEQASQATVRIGGLSIELVTEPPELTWSWWGRLVVAVPDLRACYRALRARGVEPLGEPARAEGQPMSFRVQDPDGHEWMFVDAAASRPESEPGEPASTVDRAAAESFPASDPPSFTPVTGESARRGG
jgi:hypothetical protein